MKTAVYDIKGMSCASVAVPIEKTVSKLTGVGSASINLAGEKLSLAYDEQALDQAMLADAVKNIGYELITDQPSSPAGGNGLRRETFGIAGMTCAACRTRIE